MGDQVNDADEIAIQNANEAIKQAACLECRKSKVKCVRLPNAQACKKCSNSGSECIVPDYHVGRYKGVKNKRSGLEKAIHQVEEAVKKARTQGPGLQRQHARALEKLIEGTRELPNTTRPVSGVDSSDGDRRDDLVSHTYSNDDTANSDAIVNHADNPLQLLAIASAIPENHDSEIAMSTTSMTSPGKGSSLSFDDEEIILFFSPITSNLDLGRDLDPVDLGLVTEAQAEELFA